MFVPTVLQTDRTLAKHKFLHAPDFEKRILKNKKITLIQSSKMFHAFKSLINT